MDFPYKVSIIVPVYNVEEYLEGCLDSLVNQTIGREQMEIVLINDGSPDESYKICERYAEKYPCIHYYAKQNEGLSATRNYGINRAHGKYLMYIDSDDQLTLNTVKNVTDFFDKHYNEVDLVTYIDQGYGLNGKLPLHYRYNYMPSSGVYDLENYPFISQTRVNVCVKNRPGNNILFDTTPNFRFEDQKYCTEILLQKLKIGFCKEGEYKYNRSNEGSIVSTMFHAYYIFDGAMQYFENLFNLYENNVPRYVQAMFVNDINWKLAQNILLPYHYEGEKYTKAVNRIKALLSRVDTDIIAFHPQMDKFHKSYWLEVKPNVHPVVNTEPDGVEILADGYRVYKSEEKLELIVNKIRVKNGQLQFAGFIKSPVFNHLPQPPKVYAVENGKKKELDTYISVHSHYKSEEQTSKFYAFRYYCNTAETTDFCFEVNIGEHFYKTSPWCMSTSGFTPLIKAFVREDTLITLIDDYGFTLKKISAKETEKFEKKQSKLFSFMPNVKKLRLKSIEYRKHHRIWLYNDLYTVEKDNGYYQFKNDIKHNDGIERYYVVTRDYKDIDALFTKEEQKHLVKAGSDLHKLLYVSCERVFTAFYGFTPITAFETEREELCFTDIMKFDTIYLQHGILHAHMPLNNSYERSRAEQIVISAPFEMDNYTKNYAYKPEELIPTGMARYDHIDKNRPAKNRILFAPSWRKYLTSQINAAKWDLMEDKFKKSDYYKNFLTFLTDKRIEKSLEEHDVYLDVKLHPIVSGATGLFEIDSNRINLINGDVDIEDYCAFITDFSSYVFDFAYLNRPIMYFVPDYVQFKSGMNHYRDLDLPFDKAFGHFSTDPEKAVNDLLTIIDNNFVPEEIFSERMKNFYYPLENCAEALYQYVMSKEK